MDILIDTRVFVWWEQDLARLPVRVVEALETADNRVFLSAASIWEIATKRRSGKLYFEGPLVAGMIASGFTLCPCPPKTLKSPEASTGLIVIRLTESSSLSAYVGT
jgi:PIN domain nuclease of toxin-antitoxin system